MPRNAVSSRPLTRAQQLENRAFLRELRKSGNFRLAARAVGLAYGTVQHRRRTQPAFAQACAVALAFAQADLTQAGARRPAAKAKSAEPRRTVGGEAVVVRGRDGSLQMRAAQPGKLTQQAEQAFLAALSATANVRLSAAAAGASVAAFYRRRRQRPAFAREWRLALAEGYERIELALLAGARPEAFADDDWRRNARPDMPPMTVNQALQLLHLHQKEARLGGEPAALRRRPGETWAMRREWLAILAEHRLERQREQFRVAEAERLAGGARGDISPGPGPGEMPEPKLDLAQVTGWSQASGRPGTDETTALFGGWRIGDMQRKLGEA